MTDASAPAPTPPDLTAWRFDDIRSTQDVARYWAFRRPDKVALIAGDARQTFAELYDQSRRVSGRLTQAGVQSGDHVGYIGRNTLEFFSLWLGANAIGCAIAPFNWRCSVEELVGIIGDAAPPIVIVSAECEEAMRAVHARCGAAFEMVVFTSASEGGAGLAPWLGPVEPAVWWGAVASDVALLSYTSGTTGLPKGVMASQEAFLYSFLTSALEPALAWDESDVVLMAMPNFHLGGSWLSICGLYRGATVSILPMFEPGSCIAAIARDGITIAPLVPAAVQLVLDHPAAGGDALRELKAVLYFGSTISQVLLATALARMTCSLTQIYGTTETWITTVLRHADHSDDGTDRLKSCGKPVPLTSVRVVDPDGRDLEPEQIGEVLIRTPVRFDGYWNRPDATAEALRDGWYHTGDLGRFDAAGYLYIVDRAKDMIISGGENIYSTEVEQALYKLAGIRNCAVIGLPDDRWGERVVAVILADPDAGLTPESVVDHCRTLIARYKAPKQVLFVEALPLTPTGKVKKATLRSQLLTTPATASA